MNNNENSAFGFDDPNRGPLDRAANAVTGGSGGLSGALGGTAGTQQSEGAGVVSAIFDSNDEAQRAVAERRSQGRLLIAEWLESGIGLPAAVEPAGLDVHLRNETGGAEGFATPRDRDAEKATA